MISTEKIYQSILNQLSHLPIDCLQDVDLYLKKLNEIVAKNKNNKQKILDFAGAWSDMSENDFDDFIKWREKQNLEMFNRNIDL